MSEPMAELVTEEEAQAALTYWVNQQKRRHGRKETLTEARARLGLASGWTAWTEAEDLAVVAQSRAGWTVRRMADVHGRTPGAIKSRLRHLGES